MLKLLKYELRSTSKFMFSLAGAVLFASVLFNLGLKNTLTKAVSQLEAGGGSFTSQLQLTPLLFAMIIMFGAGISFFFYLAGRLKHELFEEDGYLTFSLPLTGYEILGAKTLAAVIWGILQLTVVTLSTFLFHRFFMWEFFETAWSYNLKYAFSTEGALLLGFLVFETLLGIMVVYFAILLSKVLFRPERGRWIWFLLAMIVAFANSQLVQAVLKLFIKADQHSGFELPNLISFPLYVLDQKGLITLGLILLMSIVYFVVNGYLLDKRVEL